MLTDAEQRFIENPNSFSHDYLKVMRYRLNKKLQRLCKDYSTLKIHLDLILKKNDELNLDVEVIQSIADVILLQKPVTLEIKNSASEYSILDKNNMV